MSNYLAIATVTATMQRILQSTIQLDVPGARVTTVRPDTSGSGTPDVGVNIFLYQASPNPAWRNADLRNRRPKGDLIKQAQAGLDLFYLLTFYGNEVELEPQRLLGSTVRTIVDQPTLTAEMIQETIDHPSFQFLQTSTLAEQVERVTIVPSFLSTDDLSKIWSVFFQSPYVLSFACQGGAVLIEGDRPSGRGLPIRSRQFYATPSRPVIHRVLLGDGGTQPIVSDSRLVIRGQQLGAEVTTEQLQAEHVRRERLQQEQGQNLPAGSIQRRGTPKVQIGDAKVTPAEVQEQAIQVALADLPVEERQQLRAGLQSLQVIYPVVQQLEDLQQSDSDVDLQRIVGSNVLAIVLCPTILDTHLHRVDRDEDHVVIAEVTVDVDLTIGATQRVFLLLNQRQSDKPAAYIFAASRRAEDARSITFTIRDVKVGSYLVRLQVDNAESPLEMENEQFVRPNVVIQ